MWTGDDRYDSDEDGVNSDSQRRKRLTGERSVFDRFMGECKFIPDFDKLNQPLVSLVVFTV